MRPLILLCLVSTSAAALDCSRERLDFLSQAIERDAITARRWSLAWTVTYGAMTLGQVAVAPAFAGPDQPDWYLGAGSTALGVALLAVTPLDVIEKGPPFVRRAMGAGADVELCPLIAEGEQLLREGAGQERTGRAWYVHAGNVVFNAVFALVLGVAYGHWVSALVNFVVGTAFGEVTTFTSPTGMIQAWDTYQGMLP